MVIERIETVMRKIKKLLTMTLIASTLLSTSVTAREIAPTVNKTNGIPSTVVEDMTTEANTETATTATERTVKKEKKKERTTSVSNDTVNDKVKDVELDLIDEKEHITKELLIKSGKESDLPSNGEILSSYDNTYLVSFSNENEAKKIYEDKNVDASLNIPFGVATENKPSETSVIEPDIFDNLEEVIKDDNNKDDSFKVTEEDYSIAVIDTGAPKNDKNVEVISMLDDEGYDEHGHGTSMINTIKEQDKDAKILSVKALGKNGYGDAATIYAAIKYAIERKVDVINLSISGFATEGNKIIEDIIKEAVSKGIIVVGAAGNDNLPASAFIPGGIEDAIIVGACNENNERRSFSNYGVTVDYYADAGSTSQASAIVAGVISTNKGDVKKLDDIFFKTPDLSIFDEELKQYKQTNIIDKNDPDYIDVKLGYGEEPENVSDEEFLMARLFKYINYGGFHVTDVAPDLRIINNAVGDIRQGIKTAYANSHYYVLSASKINLNTIKVESEDSRWKVGNFSILYNANAGVKTERYVYLDLGEASKTEAAMNSAQPVKITFPNCVIDTLDGSLHDWVITVSSATFYWSPHDGNDEYKHSREWCPLIELHNGSRPWFTSGAKTTASATYTKVDSFNTCTFTQTVVGAADNSLLLTGFDDLDIYNNFPTSGDTYYSETIAIHNVNATGGQIWTTTDSLVDLFNYGATGVCFEGNGNSIDTGDQKGTVLLAVDPRGNTVCSWMGPRCQTAIGLSMASTITPSTCTTYALYETATAGVFDGITAVHSDTQYPGTAYAYDYPSTGRGEDTNIWEPTRVSPTPLGTPNNQVRATFTKDDQAFYLYIPRKRSTVTTYVIYETANGQWGNQAGTVNQWTAVNSQTNVVGAGYSFTYTGAEGVNTTIWNVNDTSPTPLGTPNRVVSTTFTATNQAFYLYVPRRRVTYTFDGNKPSNATSNVTNVPPSITKRYGEVCGAYANKPKLKGWRFIDFFTERTNGTAYNSSEAMTQNKTFYAHWEPLKYYIRYNGNGDTNFNNHATNGMMAGEYHQNTVTGSTAYQIFTYDSIGEGLRANGFNRKGYDFVCWNTTATRTGTDYDPGYVKPANVNWIKGDGTDTPTATLDGTHTYPVIDLYAVWRQKLGTEVLTIVSEETGNPIKGVEVRLTNTGNNVSTLTLTTNAQGQVTLSNNIHWFPFKWSSESVPAGYKDMQDVTFDINPANSNDNSFLTVNNERILYMKHVSLTLNSKVSAIIDGENAPAFMYHITGQDVAGVTHSYDVMVQTDMSTLKGKNIVPVDSGAEEPYMFAGNYTVTQYDVSRYIAGNAENVLNTTPVGKNANVDLKNNTSAEVLFPYTIKQYGGLSGVHSLINKLTK